MTEAQTVFEELDGELAAVLPELQAQVVSWRWATTFATMHVPEPWQAQRDHRDFGELLDDEPPDPSSNSLPRYGFDRDGRIVFRRGPSRRMEIRTRECGLWFEGAGVVTRIASRGIADRTAMVESTDYVYESGSMVEAHTRFATRSRWGFGMRRESKWFRYDDDGRLTLVIWVNDQDDGVLWPRAQRLSWSSGGELALVTETWGDEHVPPEARGGGLLAAALEWEQRPGIWRSVVYDARVDVVEVDIPPLDEILGGLHVALADGIEQALNEVVAAGQLACPLLMLVSPGLPPSVDVVDESVRVRRRQLSYEVSEFPFHEAVPLPVLDHLDEVTLRRCRQARQIQKERPTDNPFPCRTQAQRRWAISGRVDETWPALSVDLNRRRFTNAAADFVATIRHWEDNWRLATESLGRDRVEAFRASLRPPTTKLPRGPGSLQGDDDVRRLLRSRGVSDQFVDPVTAMARWGLRLADGDGPSRVGGLPDLPPTMTWPTSEDKALNFVAQIDLAHLPAAAGRERLPADGCLLFFFAVEEFEPTTAGPVDRARVIFLPADTPTSPAQPPPGVEPYGSKLVAAVPRLTLPAPSSIISTLGLDHYEMQAYTAAWQRSQAMKTTPATHRIADQILGHPTPIQDDPRLTASDRPLDWTLLLEIDNDQSRGLDLADGGALYFMIPTSALTAGQWGATFVDAQSG